MTTAGRSAGGQVDGRVGDPGAPSLASNDVLRRRRRFVRHLLGYVAVNVLLVAVWLIVGMGSDSWIFWPVFVLAGWGLLLDVHAWWAYGRPSRTGSSRPLAP